MANTSSAKKAARQTEKRTAVNRIRRSRVRSFLRKVEEAIASGNRDVATTSLREAESELMRAAGKGVVEKKAASRKVSRLTARVRAIAV